MIMNAVFEREPDKETRGCHRYRHIEGDRGVTTLYIRKEEMRDNPPPDVISITIVSQ